MSLFNRLKPPTTTGVTKDELPMHIQLGKHKLQLDARGEWQLVSDSSSASLFRQVNDLQSRVAQLEKEKAALIAANPSTTSSSISTSTSTTSLSESTTLLQEKRLNLSLQREIAELSKENSEVKYRNKLLLALCTINEADYKKLCKDVEGVIGTNKSTGSVHNSIHDENLFRHHNNNHHEQRTSVNESNNSSNNNVYESRKSAQVVPAGYDNNERQQQMQSKQKQALKHSPSQQHYQTPQQGIIVSRA